MIGLCFEAESTCSKCSAPLPINALTDVIICSQCRHKNTFTVDEWKELLSDLFKDGLTYKENEGQPSTVMGARTYKLIIGRQMPKFSDTKTYMDMDKALNFVSSGKINNPESNIPYSIRKVPEKFKEVCPPDTYLLCEDFTQLPGNTEGVSPLDTETQAKLIPFTCPNCAGTLEITGNERTLKCKFCGTESYLSDSVWQKIHPAKTKQRFYFWFNESALPFEWENDVWSVVADASGILYMSVKPSFSSDDALWIVALNTDRTLKWKRNDLKFKTTTSGGEAKLLLNANKELLVWSGDRNTAVLLSTADGAEITRIGKKRENKDERENAVMDFEQCNAIAADIDGNYVVMVDRNIKDSDNQDCYEFMLMDKTGNLKLPWGINATQGKGLFGTLAGLFLGAGDAVYFEKMKEKTYKFRDNDIKLNVGMDGSYYLNVYSRFAKVDRTGKLIYLFKVDEGWVQGKFLGDKAGNAYYIYTLNDKNVLMKVLPDGSQKNIFIDNVTKGGSFCDENKLALSPNGTIYAVGYGGVMRSFEGDGKLLYASPESIKEEKEMMESIKEMED